MQDRGMKHVNSRRKQKAFEPRRCMRYTMGAAALLLVALAVSPALARAQNSPPTGPLIERALESRTKGNPDARIVVFEIADFQCPYCARFAGTVGPEIDQKYIDTDKVQWVFVNLPLHTHPLAWHAAEAALCAGAAGGRFWAMHDRLFELQDQWGRADDPLARFQRMAVELGVPEVAYRRCMVEDQVASLILQDLGSAISAGVSGTPTFIVMRGQEVVDQFVGVRSLEEWSQLLDPLVR